MKVLVPVKRVVHANVKANATAAEIAEAMADTRDDADVRGVIVAGAGKAFVAGADINHLVALDAIAAERSTSVGQGVMSLIENFGKAVIAAVNGYAMGGGCELAMACTIRIASPHARFGQPEVKLGVLQGYGGTQRLPRLVGKDRALQLILTGEIIEAEEALRIGLVNEVLFAICASPEDKREGTSAFLAKRKAVFHGR